MNAGEKVSRVQSQRPCDLAILEMLLEGDRIA
jgi:hypothetical protein